MAADGQIGGFTVMNDWSARDLQRLEMKVGLGSAKGKDFGTSLGPVVVTPDEFESYRKNALGKGFLMVASSPLTRSSYHAGDDFAALRAAREAKLAASA